ncbi:MAG: hypothetical protein IPH16_11875 [Haliscomenobacter sp.]|nr:hypothetical protein [Haliscomenobacter sp.]MBK7474605.1 hypothetical protein [Haliscomenobacter sp.]MBK8877747.1 hypothetical protein [Haliscomenobacter sp.]
MKRKPSPRSILIALTIMASISSYIFMNQDIRNAALIHPLEQAGPSSLEEESAELASPNPLADLKLFQKLLEVGKRFIPAT